ncbi:MAG: hypothetical protein DRN01_01110 [Thermoplasmata archaeon]|nr:MAG: hypothetical protein DRN01_01110 [Thermoplasmata archaeon]
MCNIVEIMFFKSRKKKQNDKIQSKEMEGAIERSKDVTEAWLQGGKAIGEITKTKRKKLGK